MVNINLGNDLKKYKWILISFCIAVLYWTLESVIDVMYFYDTSFIQLFLNPKPHEIWMRLIVSILVIGFGTYFQYSMNKLRKSETRIEELYSLLKSIRNINQLIVQEPEIEDLLQKSTEILMNTQGYSKSKIFIFRESETELMSQSDERFSEKLIIDLDNEENIPKYIKEVLDTKSMNVINDPQEYCNNLELSDLSPDHKSIVLPIMRDDELIGILLTNIEKNRAVDEEEINLLKEIAMDLSYAISKIRINKRIQELDQFWETIIRNSNVWLIVFDEDKNVVAWNKAAEEISGYSKDEVIGGNKVWENLFSEKEYRKKVNNVFEEVLDNDNVIEDYETTISSKSGEKKIISWYSRNIVSGVGEVIGAVALGRDVTSKKENMKRKSFLNTLLRQDLMTKTQVIAGYLELINQEDLNKDKSKYLSKALINAKESVDKIEEFKELKEIEKIEEPGQIEIVELIKEEISEFKKENLKITTKIKQEELKVKGDSSIKKILKNILNARTRKQNTEKIKVKIETTEKEAIIKIEDDGEEIPKKIRNKIMDRLYSGESSSIGGFEYYIARELIEHNKGKLEILESESGGVRFNIHLQKI